MLGRCFNVCFCFCFLLVVERIVLWINKEAQIDHGLGLSRGSFGSVGFGVCHELSGCLVCVMLN